MNNEKKLNLAELSINLVETIQKFNVEKCDGELGTKDVLVALSNIAGNIIAHAAKDEHLEDAIGEFKTAIEVSARLHKVKNEILAN